MSEAARKSVIAIVVESLLWWMLQLGVICDHWWAERNNWWQWIGFTPQCQKPPVSFCLLSPAADHFSHHVCVCVCVKGRLKDRESCHTAQLCFKEWFLRGSEVRLDLNLPKQTPGRLRLSVNKTVVGEVIFGASGGNLAGLHFLFASVSSNSCCLSVVVPGSVSAGCKHPVIMASVTFRLCSMKLTPLTQSSCSHMLHLAYGELCSQMCECSF